MDVVEMAQAVAKEAQGLAKGAQGHGNKLHRDVVKGSKGCG